MEGVGFRDGAAASAGSKQQQDKSRRSAGSLGAEALMLPAVAPTLCKGYKCTGASTQRCIRATVRSCIQYAADAIQGGTCTLSRPAGSSC